MTLALNRIRPSIASHFPDRVCTLFATATWVCRSGSPARESRWVNAVATSPVTSTWRTPLVPSRVYRACFSMNASASATASLWASSTCAATCGGAIAHRVLTDLTGEKVRSYPATAVVLGRDSLAIVAGQLAGVGGVPAVLRAEELGGDLGADPGPLRQPGPGSRAGAPATAAWSSIRLATSTWNAVPRPCTP